jgi:hypothetical protein
MAVAACVRLARVVLGPRVRARMAEGMVDALRAHWYLCDGICSGHRARVAGRWTGKSRVAVCVWAYGPPRQVSATLDGFSHHTRLRRLTFPVRMVTYPR